MANTAELTQSPILPGDGPSEQGIDAPALFLQSLFEEQNDLTAVEEFSRYHDQSVATNDPVMSYSRLLPTTRPSEGQQFAFEVDLDRCSGCKACVTACHSLNGLSERETWRDVGVLIGGTAELPVIQHVTTACHHCLDPGCLRACPVNAYEKDVETGIVRHLDDQCIGCQYCTLACPYDVPKYNSERGIVRKCDMCADRLKVGEAPACVQSCPHEAISIQIVNVSDVRDNSEVGALIPGAPASCLTSPTTIYRTKRAFPPNLLPADFHAVTSQHPHWPLIIMLVLTQLSVGAFAVWLIGGEHVQQALGAQTGAVHSLFALTVGLIALGASTLHLGRPLYAFRAIVGLSHSWLSREIVAFGVFTGAATCYSLAYWLPDVPHWVGEWLGVTVVGIGLVAVLCSALIYVSTNREFWSLERTIIRFLMTSVVMGLAATIMTTLVLMAWQGSERLSEAVGDLVYWLAMSLLVASGFKLLYEVSLLRHLFAKQSTSLKRTARITTGAKSNFFIARMALGIIGGCAGPLFLLAEFREDQINSSILVAFSVLTFTAMLIGELLERYLFFATVSAPRMPGQPRP